MVLVIKLVVTVVAAAMVMTVALAVEEGLDVG